jgi:predicted phage terminase large subunit-like protein
MVTAGVGGPITGRGADCLVIDDPIKNAEEAYSFTRRERIWDWWRSTAFSRLEPNGIAILIMTRWHKDDLAGRLLKEMESGDKWEIIKLAAIAEENDLLGRKVGEPLWPERFGESDLKKIRAVIGSVFWSALYQQNPTDKEGSLFQRRWFKEIDRLPDLRGNVPVRYWDLASTDPKRIGANDPDWTAGALISCLDGQYIIHRVDRMRGSPKDVEDFIKAQAERDGRDVDIIIEQEPGSGGVNTIDHYQRSVLFGYTVRGSRPTGSKALRANPVSSAAEAGNVSLFSGPWVSTFLDEAESFPFGTHDDQIDAVSGAFEQLANETMPGFVIIRGGKTRRAEG